MRFVAVLPPFEPYSSSSGGALAIVAAQAAHALEQLGHEMVVIGPPTADPMPGTFLSYSTRRPVLRHLGQANARAEVAIASLVRSLDPDLALFSNWPQMGARVAKRVGQTRTAVWLHNDLPALEIADCRDWFANDQGRALAVSGWIRDAFIRRTGTSPGSTHVLYNGVDTNRFRPRAGFLEPPHRLRVGFVGRLDPNKGPDLVAQAARRCSMAGQDIDLVIAGPPVAYGISPDEHRSYVARLEEDVRGANGAMVGRATHASVSDLLRTLDVVVTPSRSEEPFCLVALEAMASGCTLIASRRGGLPEVGADVALYVDPDDPDQLYEALSELASDWRRVCSLKIAGRARSEALTWHHTAATLVDMTEVAGCR